MKKKPKKQELQTKQQVVRINGRLREIVTVKDEEGNVLQKVVRPLMTEFYSQDFVQVLIGAGILAIPVAFTEEVWNLGATLPLLNVLAVSALSLLFISIFSYASFYRKKLRGNVDEFFKRVLTTYIFSMITVALILTIIERAPWSTDWVLALKRVILVAFPASLSASVVDTIK